MARREAFAYSYRMISGLYRTLSTTLLAFGLLLAIIPTRASAAEPFRIVSYNIFGAPFTGKKIRERAPLIGQALAGLNADVIALQEAFEGCVVGNEPKWVQSKLKFPYVARGPSRLGIRCVGAGILILSRHPIVKTDRMSFKNCAGSDCLAVKGVVFARIRHPIIGEIDVYNSHLNAGDHGETRVKQVRQWLGFIQYHSGSGQRPIFLTGDLNGIPGTDEIVTLQQALDLHDSYLDHVTASAATDEIVRNGYTSDPVRNAHHLGRKGESSGKRLDYVFYRAAPGRLDSIRLLGSRLVFDEIAYENKPLSDHFGVVTDVEIARLEPQDRTSQSR